jgi:hypothetical protein
MPEPRVPGERGAELALACGETVSIHDLDMGMRELRCRCGERHALVMDVHPPSRFVPEALVEVLRETVDTTTGDPFDTMHLMGVVVDEFPEQVVAEDVAEDGSVGYALVWVADFDSRRLHEVVVELVVELMEHAVSHAEDAGAAEEFEAQMFDFDVAAFVDAYRAERDFEGEADRPV